MFYYEIETERLILKNISYIDRDFILKQFSNNAINKYLFDAEPLKTLDEADELIYYYLQPEPRPQHRWILTQKSDNAKIGTCGFHCWDTTKLCVDIGYDLQEEYWGQGFMSEALNTILDFAWNEMMIKRVYAHIYVDNLKSIRLAERLGFIFQGETEMCLFHNQQYLHKIYRLDCSSLK